MFNIDIFNAENNFELQAMSIFMYQAEENRVYKKYLKLLGVDPYEVHSIEEIPFLPIEFFKTSKVICEDLPIERVFRSSGTGLKRSTHYLANTAVYKESFIRNFEATYGGLEEICILGLLPNYQENPDSSLLFMMNELIALTKANGSAYLSLDDVQLKERLKKANRSGLKTILVGVSFALLDLAEKIPQNLGNLIIMETGGMKGQRKELTREDLHEELKEAFQVNTVHSEYGMCELLSQAYSLDGGVFTCPSWMKVFTRPLLEPFGAMELNKTGIIKVVDLANIHSCSFIETADLGMVDEAGGFKILGRVDMAELRGCNLMHQ